MNSANQSDQDRELHLPPAERHVVHLRDGRAVLLRAARAEDASALLHALNDVAAEGRFLLRREWEITPELEQRWLRVAGGGVDLLITAIELQDEHNDVEGVVAGSLSLVRGKPEFIRHTAELGMWIRSSYREVGLGSAMVEYCVRWARANDVEKICLSVRSANRRALNLYGKYGFVEEGRRRAYVKTPDGYEDEILLSCFTRPPGPPASAIAQHVAQAIGAPFDDDEEQA